MTRANPYHQRNDGGWCECAECERRFTGLRGFDAHHVAEHPDGSPHGGRCGCSDWWPRCLSDAELRAKGYTPDERGWWGSTDTDARWGRSVRTETPVDTENVKRAEGAT